MINGKVIPTPAIIPGVHELDTGVQYREKLVVEIKRDQDGRLE